jgi:hypothetical protein
VSANALGKQNRLAVRNTIRYVAVTLLLIAAFGSLLLFALGFVMAAMWGGPTPEGWWIGVLALAQALAASVLTGQLMTSDRVALHRTKIGLAVWLTLFGVTWYVSFFVQVAPFSWGLVSALVALTATILGLSVTLSRMETPQRRPGS